MSHLLISLFFLFNTSVSCGAENPKANQTKLELTPSGNVLASNTFKFVDFAKGFSLPTDLQWTPKSVGWLFIAEKNGALKIMNLKDKKVRTLVTLPVVNDSEMGLLGIAFHPNFKQNRKFYLNYNVDNPNKKKGKIPNPYLTHVAEWELSNFDFDKATATEKKVLMKVEQPYGNHKAGQLQFGPDGYLYVGFGDGGASDDPHGNGQNMEAILGSMQRLDVKTGKSSTWTKGLRNPWRYTFDKQGRIIVADVGQNKFEEVSIIDRAGMNLGWNEMEANHCFKSEKCEAQKFQVATIEYGRQWGQSITGGYIMEKKGHPLDGHYIYADYASGRLWAAVMPTKSSTILKPQDIKFLGQYRKSIATFGKDPDGNVYVADLATGEIFLMQ